MSIPLLKQGVWIPQSLDCRLLDDANLMRPRQGRGGHIWDSHIQESNAVERVRSMPDYIVSSEKGLKLVEVKFRKRSERDGHPGWTADPLSLPRSFTHEKEAQKETRS